MPWHGYVPPVDSGVWRVEVRSWRERRAILAAEQLRGAEKVLELADRMRKCGGAAPHRLHHETLQAFARGEIAFDEVTPVYRHAMIHAGAIVPRDRPRFYHCPECEAEFGDGSRSG